MKLYGYKTTEVDVTTWSTGELAELTLVANPTELRRIAAFLHGRAPMQSFIPATLLPSSPRKRGSSSTVARKITMGPRFSRG